MMLRTLRWWMVLSLMTACVAQAQTLNLRERLRKPAAAAEAADTALGAGTHTLQVSAAGQERKVVVHVPASYDPSRPMPVVLALHGGGGWAEFMADDERYGLISKADSAGFVVAFPNGYSKLPGGRFATWNAGGCCGDARDKNVDDVGLLRAVVAQLKKQLNVDAARVYATGMSNGGMMSHRLACDAADVFAAVASVAGTDATDACTPARPIPVLHIHALDDDHVLFKGGAGPKAFRDESKVMNFVSVPETVARWARRDQCTDKPQRILDKPGAYCELQSACAGASQVQLCVVETGGHSWPGAQKVRRGKDAASQSLIANDVIWTFFQAHTLR